MMHKLADVAETCSSKNSGVRSSASAKNSAQRLGEPVKLAIGLLTAGRSPTGRTRRVGAKLG